jgi:hypothetical protein
MGNGAALGVSARAHPRLHTMARAEPGPHGCQFPLSPFPSRYRKLAKFLFADHPPFGVCGDYGALREPCLSRDRAEIRAKHISRLWTLWLLPRGDGLINPAGTGALNSRWLSYNIGQPLVRVGTFGLTGRRTELYDNSRTQTGDWLAFDPRSAVRHREPGGSRGGGSRAPPFPNTRTEHSTA